MRRLLKASEGHRHGKCYCDLSFRVCGRWEVPIGEKDRLRILWRYLLRHQYHQWRGGRSQVGVHQGSTPTATLRVQALQNPSGTVEFAKIDHLFVFVTFLTFSFLRLELSRIVLRLV